MPFGYDVEGHLYVLSHISMRQPVLPFAENYYALHPPMGFFFAKAFTVLGVGDLAATQCASFVASIVILLCLRAFVRSLRLLERPEGIFFVYFCCSMPMMVYLSISTNLDVFILMYASMLLCACVWCFQGRRMTFLRYASVIGLLVLSYLTKYSGLILSALPFIVGVSMDSFSRGIKRAAPHALVIVCSALLIVAPYYIMRNYVPTGEFLYNPAGNSFFTEAVVGGREWRDHHLFEFFSRLFLPYFDSGGVVQEPYLAISWDSFWSGADRAPQSLYAQWIASGYAVVFFFLCCLATVHYFFWRKDTSWQQLGRITLAFSALQVLALVYYAYQYPVLPGYFTVKGIYISSAMLGISFLVASLTRVSAKTAYSLLPLSFLAWFIVANHTLPVF